jgi:hypothetical protein
MSLSFDRFADRLFYSQGVLGMKRLLLLLLLVLGVAGCGAPSLEEMNAVIRKDDMGTLSRFDSRALGLLTPGYRIWRG